MLSAPLVMIWALPATALYTETACATLVPDESLRFLVTTEALLLASILIAGALGAMAYVFPLVAWKGEYTFPSEAAKPHKGVVPLLGLTKNSVLMANCAPTFFM